MGSFPQKVIDTVIDLFAASEAELRANYLNPHVLANCHPREESTLRACALTSRAFLPRSQRHLFTSIYCRTSDSDKLEALVEVLVSGSLQIASYIEYFSFVQAYGPANIKVADVPALSRILGLLPNLVHLKLSVFERWDTQPAIFTNALHGALRLPSFRSLTLAHCTFANVMELESLLSHARGLKELILSLRFDDTSARPVDPGSEDALIILDSLKVGFGDIRAEDAALLSSFKAIDIRHLRSLDIGIDTPLVRLLTANAQTVEKVRCSFPLSSLKPLSSYLTLIYESAGEHSDPNILENNICLRHIDIREGNSDMADTLKMFGNLRHLTALQTVSLHFRDQFSGQLDTTMDDLWLDLDAILAQAGDTLKDVQIYAYTDKNRQIPPELGLVRGWLPSVADKISVYLRDW